MINHETEHKTFYCPNCNSIVETRVLFSYNYDITYKDEFQNEGTEVFLGKCKLKARRNK